MRKFIIWTLFVLVLFFALLHLPQLFISKQLDYGAFSVYSNEDIHSVAEMKASLDSITVLLKKSSLYDQEQSHKVFLVRNSFYEKLIRLIGYDNMAFSFLSNQIYAAHLNLESGQFHRNNNEYEVLDAIQLITHESVHNQAFDKYRFSVEHWVNEGYAEYISYAPVRQEEDYSLSAVVDRLEKNEGQTWVKTEYNLWTPWNYIFYRVLVEYLIDIKGYDIQEIIENDQLHPETLYQELKNYYNIS